MAENSRQGCFGSWSAWADLHSATDLQYLDSTRSFWGFSFLLGKLRLIQYSAFILWNRASSEADDNNVFALVSREFSSSHRCFHLRLSYFLFSAA